MFGDNSAMSDPILTYFFQEVNVAITVKVSEI